MTYIKLTIVVQAQVEGAVHLQVQLLTCFKCGLPDNLFTSEPEPFATYCARTRRLACVSSAVLQQIKF